MYAAYLGGNGAATLAEDDIAGVCSLYPSGAAPECQRDDDCDGDERCVAGSCVAGEAQGTGAIGDPCGQAAPCDNGLFCVSGGSGPFCTRSVLHALCGRASRSDQRASNADLPA